MIFSWIVYENREARDAVNKKAIEDPRLKKFMDNGKRALRRQAHDIRRLPALSGPVTTATWMR